MWSSAELRVESIEVLRIRKWRWTPTGIMVRALLEWNPQSSQRRGRPRINRDMSRIGYTWSELKVIVKFEWYGRSRGV